MVETPGTVEEHCMLAFLVCLSSLHANWLYHYAGGRTSRRDYKALYVAILENVSVRSGFGPVFDRAFGITLFIESRYIRVVVQSFD